MKERPAETARCTHVSQSPERTRPSMLPPLHRRSAASPGGPGAPEATAGKFRIEIPVPGQPLQWAPETRPPRLDHPLSAASCAVSRPDPPPAQVRSHSRGSHFRRTASFHEARAGPAVPEGLSTLTPRPTPAHGPRARTWDQAGERTRPASSRRCAVPGERDHGPGAGASGPFSLSPNPTPWDL